MESESVENKSTYDASKSMQARLVKTIISMANTDGGRYLIASVDCDPDKLDSATIDTLVNKHVEPRVRGIRAEVKDGACEVVVAKSDTQPHIVTKQLQYPEEKGGKIVQHIELHRGQVWVRHGSKNEPATADDLDRMLRAHFHRRLEELGAVTIERPYYVTENEGMAVHIAADGEEALPVGDIQKLYPHTAGSVAKELRTSWGWVGTIAKKLGLKKDRALSYLVANPDGTELQWRYSDGGRQRIFEEMRARELRS